VVAISVPRVDWLVVGLGVLRVTLLALQLNRLLHLSLLLNLLNGPFPLLDKAVAASRPRGRQLLNVGVLPVLLLNLLRNVGQRQLRGRLELVLDNVPLVSLQELPEAVQKL
jgi:hypothetical protein